MATATWRDDGIADLEGALLATVEGGEVPGLVWLLARGGDVQTGAIGSFEQSGQGRPMSTDTIVRIASMTKPVAAMVMLQLVDEGRMGLDDPIDPLVPELADRQVLVDPAGPVGQTVPAERAITVRDLLTFRCGLGFDFRATGPQASIEAMAAAGLPMGPPSPALTPPADDWIGRLAAVPLAHQPGTHWLYHVPADILGVLISRACDQTLEAVFHERVFEPLGMADTGFWVPPDRLDRFGPCFSHNPETGERSLYDPADGQWSRPPVFASAGGGLVSTVEDFLRFSDALAAVDPALRTNQLTAAQLAVSGPDPRGDLGWGFGVGVQVVAEPGGPNVGTYGWDGGLGTSWAVDPVAGLTGILLTNQAFDSPVPPAVVDVFWRAAYGALA